MSTILICRNYGIGTKIKPNPLKKRWHVSASTRQSEEKGRRKRSSLSNAITTDGTRWRSTAPSSTKLTTKWSSIKPSFAPIPDYPRYLTLASPKPAPLHTGFRNLGRGGGRGEAGEQNRKEEKREKQIEKGGRKEEEEGEGRACWI